MRRFACLYAAATVAGGGIPTSNALAQHTVVAANSQESDADRILDHKVTIKVENVSLERAIQVVSAAANATVLADQSALSRYSRRVTLQTHDESLRSVFERLLAGTALQVVARPHSRLIVTVIDGAVPVDSVPGGGTVSGRIVDSATGRGINGVTVKVAGSRISAMSADSGRFTLRDVPAGDQLLSAKVFGYRPGEHTVSVVVNQRVTAKIALSSAPNVLSGVVTTATGVQERRSVGNDITVINADSVMRIAPISTVTDLLEGRVPGMVVQHTSGVPGAPSRIRLRGIGGGLIPGAANTSNDPIVIVDGIRIYSRQSTTRDQSLAPQVTHVGSGMTNADPTSSEPPASAIDQIDPNTIDKIEVFKGPSATSQWGADAANGVIVITTKRGRAGPTKVDVALNTSVQKMPGRYAPLGYYPFGTYDFFGSSGQCSIFGQATYVDPLYGNPTSPCLKIDSVATFQAANDPRFSPFGTGLQQGGALTISGGAPSIDYSITASSDNTLGYLRMPTFYQDLFQTQYEKTVPGWARRPDTYRTWSVAPVVTITPATALRLTLAGSVFNSQKGQTQGQDQLSTISRIYFDSAQFAFYGRVGLVVAPYLQRSQSHTVTSNGNLAASWSRWANLPIDGTVGISTQERTDQNSLSAGFTGTDGTSYGAFSLGHGQAQTRTGTLNATLLPAHLLSLSGGVNATISNTDDFSGFQDTLQVGVDEPSALRSATRSTTSLTTAGWFIEPKLNIQSRFFVTPGFRFDGGNASSGTKNNSGLSGGALSLFPRLNFSWIMVDRSDAPGLGGFLTLLRPRVAFGIAGVQPQPDWRIRLLTDGQLRDPVTNVPYQSDGVLLYSLGNTKLHPERSRETELGFEAEFWHGRASVDFTIGNQLRMDAIQQISTPGSVYGGMPLFMNIGRVQNQSIESEFKVRVIETGMLAWSVNASPNALHNKITRLYGNLPFRASTGGTRLVEGYPVDGRWARPIVGYRDVNHNGRIELDEVTIADSAVYMGDGLPRLQIPFGTNVSLWHGLVSINAEFFYKGGLTQVNSGGGQLLTNIYANPNATPGQQAVAVTAAACLIDLTGYIYNPNEGCRTNTSGADPGTDYGLFQTVSTLRFNTFSIGYSVPPSVSRRLRVARMYVALQGSNLALWTNYRGKDPDVNANIVGDAINDTGQAPEPRTWRISVNLGN